METSRNEVTANTWREFLQSQGANYREGFVEDFGNPDAERRAVAASNVLVDLSHFALLSATGADAKTFLNGQLTNDIALLDATHSQLSAWCSPKGRMLTVFRVIPQSDGYLLQLPAPLHDDISKRLRMYILRSKVTLTSADENYVRIGFAGPNAAERVRAAVGTVPTETNGVARSGEHIVLALPGFHPRYEILCPPSDAQRVWQQLSADAVRAGAAAWTWHDIMAGLPTVLPETSDAFIPQMANMDLVNGLSFKKGCYTGQEIVARVHYLGRLKQRMYRAHVEASNAPKPGLAIYAGGQSQSTGTVVSAAPSPTSGYDLLAVIHVESAEKGGLHLEHVDGPALSLEPLPYTLA